MKSTRASARRATRHLVTASTSCFIVLASTACAKPVSHPPVDIVLADFDGGVYLAGWSTTGEAFGSAPASGTLPDQNPVSGFQGTGLVNSYHGTDRTTGTLTSPQFSVSRRYLRFMVGGGNHPDSERIELVVDGASVASATGADSERLRWRQWELSAYRGREAVILIVDSSDGGWGHILVDQITLTDSPLPDESAHAVAQATAAVIAAVPTAAADSSRPAYHFHAPAQWMNDPNGPIYYRGWYHLFYQHNPYGPKWDSMHWGHARSKDLVNWEQLPVALSPSYSLGEDHVFSGSTFPRADGTPMAFYTSIGGKDPEQWGALPTSSDLVTWKKDPHNPLLTKKDSRGKGHC